MNINFQAILSNIRPALPLPVIPEGSLPGIACDDHMTWVVSQENRGAFIQFWKEYLETDLVEDIWVTEEFPAEHIALKPIDTVSILSCEGMVGLSVPLAGDTVLTESLSRYGTATPIMKDGVELTVPGIPQHVAYAVHPSVSMEDARAQVESLGHHFFTPAIEYHDDFGSVEQCFFGSTKPFGTFCELVRRTGEPKQAFAAGSIDFLYQHYCADSKKLEEGYVS